MTAQGIGTGRRVLVVEDDAAMSVALSHGFSSEGFEVLLAGNGEEGLRKAGEAAPDLVILDVMLPRMSGLDLCRKLRAAGDEIPIVMLTARGQEADKVLGLKLGADDYVTKPFSFLELMARVETILRRCGNAAARSALESFQFDDVFVDFRRHEATKSGQPIELSAREFVLLAYLVAHRGEVLSRERLLDDVWGYDSMPLTRTVDTHVAKLRKKIETDPAHPRQLITVHRVGYKFMA